MRLTENEAGIKVMNALKEIGPSNAAIRAFVKLLEEFELIKIVGKDARRTHQDD